ncbi:hypothetical protein JCM11491_001743 [Sporobolomyces phaffii]
MSCLATPLRFLPVHRHELHLATVLKSGQSFRWHRSSPPVATRPATDSDEEWSFGWGDRTVVLRQDDDGVHYRALYPSKPPHTAYWADVKNDTTRPLLVDYFQLATPLAPLYDQWSAADPKFATKINLDPDTHERSLRGIRVLKQDEWETLVSFICSANNNIARITLMVNRLCAQLGTRLPHPSHFDPARVYSDPAVAIPPFGPGPESLETNDDGDDIMSLYSFPPPEALVDLARTESLLRQLGFGYRANFIPTSALHLVETADRLGVSPRAYLRSLRKDAYVPECAGAGVREVRERLLEFKGVGRKVADCVMLFGLGWSEVVPVDTHVFQIAIRDYGFPATKSTALSPALHDKVSEHLAKKWQPHAGWCQQVLFFADLKPASPVKKQRQEVTYSRIEVEAQLDDDDGGDEGFDVREQKKSFEEQVKEIMDNPGRKRRRVTVIKTEVVKVEQETTEGDELAAGGAGRKTPDAASKTRRGTYGERGLPHALETVLRWTDPVAAVARHILVAAFCAAVVFAWHAHTSLKRLGEGSYSVHVLTVLDHEGNIVDPGYTFAGYVNLRASPGSRPTTSVR